MQNSKKKRSNTHTLEWKIFRLQNGIRTPKSIHGWNLFIGACYLDGISQFSSCCTYIVHTWIHSYLSSSRALALPCAFFGSILKVAITFPLSLAHSLRVIFFCMLIPMCVAGTMTRRYCCTYGNNIDTHTHTHINYHNLNFMNWMCFLWVYGIFVATSAIIFRFEFVSSPTMTRMAKKKEFSVGRKNATFFESKKNFILLGACTHIIIIIIVFVDQTPDGEANKRTSEWHACMQIYVMETVE